MLTLYQTEWCPYSHVVRQRLTELGIDYVARQVPAQRDDRTELRRATGADCVPILIPDEGRSIEGAEEILSYLSQRFEESRDAEIHRAKAREHVPRFLEMTRSQLAVGAEERLAGRRLLLRYRTELVWKAVSRD